MPPGALRAPISVVIVPLEAWPSGALGQVFDIEPSGIQFATPATITYTYEDAELAGANPAALRLGLAEGPNWTPLVSRVDLVRHLVSASIPHLSVYGLLAPTAGESGIADSGTTTEGGRRWPTHIVGRRRRQSRKRLRAKMHKRRGRLRSTEWSSREGPEPNQPAVRVADGRARLDEKPGGVIKTQLGDGKIAAIGSYGRRDGATKKGAGTNRRRRREVNGVWPRHEERRASGAGRARRYLALRRFR